VSEDRDALRAADVDRQFVADRLREALSEGRLDLNEYDERLQEAYNARTYGDLKSLLSDLPTVAPAGRSQMMPMPSLAPQVAQAPRGLTAEWVAQQWSGWFTLALMLTAIWLLSGHGYYWPVWPVGVLGAINLAKTFQGLASGEPRKQFERRQLKAIKREERKAEEREQRKTDDRAQTDSDD
jgi:hypothetical protein